MLTADTDTDEQIRELAMIIETAAALASPRRKREPRIRSLMAKHGQPAMQIAVVYNTGSDESPPGYRACTRNNLWLDDAERLLGFVDIDANTRGIDITTRCAEILNARAQGTK